MSSMLEQAIVDANALREVAVKNAEAAVIEKYSEQIKEAVDKLLEQDELDLAQEQPVEIEVAEPVVDKMPLAATDGENLCGCPDEQEEVEINFDDLARQMEEEGEPVADLESHETAAEEVVGDEEEIDFTLEEDLNIEDIELEELAEKLKVDITPQKSGWAGDPSEKQYEFAEKEILALEQDTEVKEELAAMRKAAKKLEENNQSLEEKVTALKNKNSKIAELFSSLKEKLSEATTMNAKLLYTNKVLVDTSLNERQKNKIVESISRANTVEEAQVIFETLQSTVGTPSQKKQPKSLSEVVSKTTSTMLLSSSEKKEKSNPELNRWKILAGLNNK